MQCPCGSEDCASSSGTSNKITTNTTNSHHNEANIPPPHHSIFHPPNLTLTHHSLPTLFTRIAHSLEALSPGLGWAFHFFVGEVGFILPDFGIDSDGLGKGNRKGKAKAHDGIIHVHLLWEGGLGVQPYVMGGEVVWVVSVGLGMGRWIGLRNDGEDNDEGSEHGGKRKRDQDAGEDEDGSRKRQDSKSEDEDGISETESIWDFGFDDDSDEDEDEIGDDEEDKRDGKHRDSGVGIRINMS